MRLLSTIDIKIKKGSFPLLMDMVYRENCTIQKAELSITSGVEEEFLLEISYNRRDNLKSLVKKIYDNDNFKLNSVSSHLEKEIAGGLLTVSGKMPLNDYNDYQIGILGAYDLIFEKINELNGTEFTGISKSVGLISGIKENDDILEEDILKIYARSEADSALIHRFSGLNGYPLIISYSPVEDLIKTIQRIERSFSIIKIMNTDEIDMSVYDQLTSNVSVPVVSREMDDIPIYLLSLINRIISKSGLALEETTIGFMGVDISAIRITGLLMRMGLRRVLGYDSNEKVLLSLENLGGMATTGENIFSNSDIIIFFKDILSREEYKNVRPGQYLISLFTRDDIDVRKIFEKGVKKFIPLDDMSYSVISPGLLTGVLSSGYKYIDDMRVIEISRKLVDLLDDDYKFPDLFGDIHSRVSELVIQSSARED